MEAAKQLIEKFETAGQIIEEVGPVYHALKRRRDLLQKSLTGLEAELPDLLVQLFLGKIDSLRPDKNKELTKRTKHELLDIELALPVMDKRIDAASQTQRNCYAKSVNAFNRLYDHIEGGTYTDADIETFKAITDISTHRDHPHRAAELLASLQDDEAGNANQA